MKYYGWHKIYNILGLKYKTKYKPEHKDCVNIIFAKEDGIGNRIFGLVNVINWFSPKEINILWPNKGWVSERFSDLFEFEGYNINEFNTQEIFQKRISAVKNSITIERPACNLKTRKNTDISLKYNKIKESDKNEIKAIISKLKPSKKVQEILDKQGIKDYVSLQIRNAPDWKEFRRNTDIENFKTAINQLEANKTIYLCAMSENISKEIQNEKYQICELKNKNYNSMYDAVADLYMLSNAKEAVYSFGSTFCELAFWLSKYDQKVTIVGSGKNWKPTK